MTFEVTDAEVALLNIDRFVGMTGPPLEFAA
jgi:hypothetical protein